jgi:hypothetical protein
MNSTLPEPKEGDLWRYDYLWRWQADQGETEGRKARPVSFVAAFNVAPGITHVYLLALTTVQPGSERLAIEIPAFEQKQAGLEGDARVWIILDEVNHDILQVSSYFDPSARIGSFSPRFRRQVVAEFQVAFRARTLQIVKR